MFIDINHADYDSNFILSVYFKMFIFQGQTKIGYLVKFSDHEHNVKDHFILKLGILFRKSIFVSWEETPGQFHVKMQHLYSFYIFIPEPLVSSDL